MLVKEETIEQRLDFLWNFIHITQDLIKVVRELEQTSLRDKVIQLEIEQIREIYQELKELKRWHNEQE